MGVLFRGPPDIGRPSAATAHKRGSPAGVEAADDVGNLTRDWGSDQ